MKEQKKTEEDLYIMKKKKKNCEKSIQLLLFFAFDDFKAVYSICIRSAICTILTAKFIRFIAHHIAHTTLGIERERERKTESFNFL